MDVGTSKGQCFITGLRLAQWRFSEYGTVNLPLKLMRGIMFNQPLNPPLSQTHVICRLFYAENIF